MSLQNHYRHGGVNKKFEGTKDTSNSIRLDKEAMSQQINQRLRANKVKTMRLRANKRNKEAKGQQIKQRLRANK